MTQDISRCKEEFSKAYVRAICSVAKLAVHPPDVDNDSIDFTIKMKGKLSGFTVHSPHVDLQLKCTETAIANSDTFSYSLTLKNYDDLRVVDVQVPRILVVVLVPKEIAEWSYHNDDEMVLRKCGYWVSLRGLPESSNTTGVTVHVPTEQKLTVTSLQEMITRIGMGGLP